MFNSSKDSSQPTHKNRTSGPGTGSQLTPSSKDAAAAGQAGAKVRERKFENGDRYRGGWLSGLVSNGPDLRAQYNPEYWMPEMAPTWRCLATNGGTAAATLDDAMA